MLPLTRRRCSIFTVAADAESGGGGGVEVGFKHFSRAQPCGDEAVAVHRFFGLALLPVYAAVEHQVVARKVRQGVVNGEEATVEQTGFVCMRKMFPLGFGAPRPAAFVEIPFAAYAIGAVEGFAAAAVPFDERGEGEGVAVFFCRFSFIEHSLRKNDGGENYVFVVSRTYRYVRRSFCSAKHFIGEVLAQN